MTKRILLASPDRYGRFGHQTTSIFAGVALAQLSGSLLLHPRYMFFSDQWNEYIDWARSRFITTKITGDRRVVYLEKTQRDQHGNRKWRLSNSEIKDILEKITAIPEDSIVHLPFDQSAGNLIRLATRKDVRTDLNKVFGISKWQIPEKKYACIHVRRGDCTPDRYKEWYVSDSFYIKLIRCLNEALPLSMPIVICTQGNMQILENEIQDLITGNRVKIQTTDQLWTNDREVNDFITLAQASILITARSSFSRWAGLIGPHKLVVDVNRQRLVNHGEHMVVHPDEKEQKWKKPLQDLVAKYASQYL